MLPDEPKLELEDRDGHLREQRVGARHIGRVRVDERGVDHRHGAAITRVGVRVTPATIGGSKAAPNSKVAPNSRLASAGAVSSRATPGTSSRAAPLTIRTTRAAPIAVGTLRAAPLTIRATRAAPIAVGTLRAAVAAVATVASAYVA